MKRALVYISSVLAALIVMASCTKDETHAYVCTCSSAVAGGATESYIIESTSEDMAREQCDSYDEPPTDLRANCGLE
jgi:hypothetical protein